MKSPMEDICKMKILVVDDDLDIAEMFRHILFRSFPMHEIYIARDGMEADEMAAEYDPDIFIIDLYMPFVDGFHLLQAVCRGKHREIIVISSCSDSKTAEKCARAGASFFMTKPIILQSFILMIDSLMEKVFLKRLEDARTFRRNFSF